MDRRRFLVDAGVLAGVASCGLWEPDARAPAETFHLDDWDSVRAQFATPAMRAIA